MGLGFWETGAGVLTGAGVREQVSSTVLDAPRNNYVGIVVNSGCIGSVNCV